MLFFKHLQTPLISVMWGGRGEMQNLDMSYFFVILQSNSFDKEFVFCSYKTLNL